MTNKDSSKYNQHNEPFVMHHHLHCHQLKLTLFVIQNILWYRRIPYCTKRMHTSSLQPNFNNAIFIYVSDLVYFYLLTIQYICLHTYVTRSYILFQRIELWHEYVSGLHTYAFFVGGWMDRCWSGTWKIHCEVIFLGQ